MIQPIPEHEELRINIERLRALLETLVVRGLRACGADELAHLRSYTEHLEQAGAGHVAAVLSELHTKIESGDRAAARTLLMAQTSVRLLERLLTLRVVGAQFDAALAEPVADASNVEDDDQDDEDEDDS